MKRKSKIKLAIFDVDGTLLETSEGIISSALYALNSKGLSLPNDFNTDTLIGPPIQDSFAKLFPELSQEEIKELSLVFRNHYKDVDLYKAKVYDGIIEMLQNLCKNGLKVAIATYKREDYARDIVAHFGLDEYSSCTHGQDFEGIRKKKDIIALCLKELGISNEEAVMIGDASSDYLGALANEVAFIPVTYGYGFKSLSDVEDIKHLGVASTPMDIWRIIYEENL